jgi:hypothetical protein
VAGDGLGIPVADHVNPTLRDPAIAAVQIVNLAEADRIRTSTGSSARG